jgi:hypothetical protein
MNILPAIEVPTYTLELPSTKQLITYRPYLVREEKVLLIALETEDPDAMQLAIGDIVKGCIISDIKFNELTMYDVEYLFLMIRAKSVGEKATVFAGCDAEECEEVAKLEVDFMDIVIANNNDDKQFRYDLGGGIIIDMGHPNMGDKALLKGIPEDDIVISTVASSIDTIYYNDEVYTVSTIPLEEVVEFLGSMNTKQFGPLLDVVLDQPYVQYKKDWKCKCGYENHVEYNGLVDFFI